MIDTDFCSPERLAYEDTLDDVKLEHPASVALDPGKDYSAVFGDLADHAIFGGQTLRVGTSLKTCKTVYVESTGFGEDRLERLHCDPETLDAALDAPLKQVEPSPYNTLGTCAMCAKWKMLLNGWCAQCAGQMSREG